MRHNCSHCILQQCGGSTNNERIALEKKPERRYQQVSEVKTQVEAIASTLGESVPEAVANSRPSKPWAVSRRGALLALAVLAGVLALFFWRSFVAQNVLFSNRADVRLQSKVKYAAEEASVQDIVQNLAEQVGLKYDREKSRSQTDPLCRNWVQNVTIDGKSCRQALDQILKPVGLRYQVENGVIVLSPVTGPEPPKLAAARKALTGPNKDLPTARKLLLELVGKERATVPPVYLSYACVYLGYIEDRAGKRMEAIDWYRQALTKGKPDEGMRECAESGLKEPMVWIRHLDQGTSPAQPAPSVQAPAAGERLRDHRAGANRTHSCTDSFSQILVPLFR